MTLPILVILLSVSQYLALLFCEEKKKGGWGEKIKKRKKKSLGMVKSQILEG